MIFERGRIFEWFKIQKKIIEYEYLEICDLKTIRSKILKVDHLSLHHPSNVGVKCIHPFGSITNRKSESNIKFVKFNSTEIFYLGIKKNSFTSRVKNWFLFFLEREAVTYNYLSTEFHSPSSHLSNLCHFSYMFTSKSYTFAEVSKFL